MSMINSIQNLRGFVHEPLQFMQKMHERHGDFFSLYLGHKKFHFACHPDFAAQILNSRVDHYRKSRLIFDKIKPITGENGLVQLDGEAWQDMRRITSETFHGKYFDHYVEIINQYADQLVDQIRQQVAACNTIDVSALMIRYTINIAVRIFLGIEHDDQVDLIAKKFIELNYLCGLKMRQVFASPLWVPSKLNLKINSVRNQLKTAITQLIATASQKSEMSLLAKLTTALPNNEDKQQWIHDQIMTFIFAGYETTAASLSFCLFLLAKHGNAQQKIRQEAAADASEYTLAAYREALRLYPPAYMLAREVIHEDELAGNKVKVGENIILPLYEIHRHKNSWSNGSDFLPERFLKSNKIELHKFAFLPFGYGKRVCSGMQLAMTEAAIILQKLVKHFDFHLSTPLDLQVEAMVTLSPKGQVNLMVKTI